MSCLPSGCVVRTVLRTLAALDRTDEWPTPYDSRHTCLGIGRLPAVERDGVALDAVGDHEREIRTAILLAWLRLGPLAVDSHVFGRDEMRGVRGVQTGHLAVNLPRGRVLGGSGLCRSGCLRSRGVLVAAMADQSHRDDSHRRGDNPA